MNEKELLQQLVKECSSFAEILRKQGKAVSGAAVKILKEKLDTYKIPYHFITIHKEIGKSRPLSEILTQGVDYQSSKLKKRLVKEGYKEDKCELCGQLPQWNGKPLVLQLDHINGDHFDNRLENLRIVCPNCHTQTDTFCTKRNKKEYFCIDCGKQINRGSTRCLKCSAIYTAMKKQQESNKEYPSKEELEKLILEKTFEDIGRMYGVKGNSVKKWCKKYELPFRKIDIKQIYFGKPYVPLKTINCTQCGKTFKQEDQSQQFCSKECYNNFVKEHGHIWKNSNYENLAIVTKEKILEFKNKNYSFTKTARELKISRTALERKCIIFEIPIWKNKK